SQEIRRRSYEGKPGGTIEGGKVEISPEARRLAKNDVAPPGSTIRVRPNDDVRKAIAIHISCPAHRYPRAVARRDSAQFETGAAIQRGEIHGGRKPGSFSENDVGGARISPVRTGSGCADEQIV